MDKNIKRKAENNMTLYLLVVLLGGAVGAILWCFLKAVGLCTDLLWDIIPEKTGIRWIPVVICTAGGLLTGLIRKKHGDYPEELPVVLGKIKKDHHYDYRPMLVMIVCAFLPLILGASVGPEAGLTGIIAGLCYWVGDNVKYAKEHTDEYTEIGAAVTLGSLFHVPLFGIFAVEEQAEDEYAEQFASNLKEQKSAADELVNQESAAGEERAETSGSTDVLSVNAENKSGSLKRGTKLLLYGLSMAAAFLVMKCLGRLFGAAGEGFPSFDSVTPDPKDYALVLICVPLGLLLYYAFSFSEKLTGAIAARLPAVVKETVCGLCVGLVALALPAILFSGEEQMGMLPEVYTGYAPLVLIGICFAKIIMTALCIEFGLKGGHFFPLIYACSCMGFGLSLLIFGGGGTEHAIFAAAVVTAAALGAQLKKPLAVSMLLLISFPVRLILWILLAAAAGSKIAGKLSRVKT